MEEQNIDKIEQYLNGKLSPAARSELERNLAVDDDLQDEFDKRQLAHETIELLIEDDLRASLRVLERADSEAINSETAKVRSMGRGRRMFLISATACVILLVGFFALYSNIIGGSSPEQLAANYYERPSFDLRRVTDTPLNSLKDGLAFLKADEYSNAIQAFEAIPASDEYYIAAQYYRAHALYLQQDFESAQATFEQVTAADDARYIENSEWYALLACLAKNGACDTLFTKILADEGHSYYQQTKELEQQL